MKDSTYMGIAELVAKESKCVSLSVGAVLVNQEGKIISTGYNGTVKGDINCNEKFSCRCPEHHEWSLKREIHAEMNCITNADVPVRGCKIYITHFPCYNCLKHLAAFGIIEVCFKDYYHRHTDDDLKEAYEYATLTNILMRKIE